MSSSIGVPGTERHVRRATTAVPSAAVKDPQLYRRLAPWFHLLTTPDDYEDEAAFYAGVLERTARGPVGTVLELGSGGGNNALFLKRRFLVTLTDLSSEMLEVSKRINPDCRHIVGDMRTLRLGETFDAVLVHDAVMYMTTEEDLSAAMHTAYAHCRPGGAALFVPDAVTETFAAGVHTGGHDGEGRALRYLQWTWDPDPDDTTYRVDMAIMLRTSGVEAVHDVHEFGIFPRTTWLRLLEEAGFVAETVPTPFANEAFAASRPAGR
jgi:SAM-dependent methyltransferase